jgi:hypothetical protein
MQFLVAGLILLLAASTVVTLRARTDPRRAPSDRYTMDRLKSMSRQEVQRLLERVQKADEPEATFGAMCYEAVALPETAEYICPVCGQKTTYTSDNAATILYELPATRRLFDELVASTELDMVLDETQFCSFCSEADGDSRLVLRVTYDNGMVVSSEVGEMDMRLLTGLLTGQLTFSTFNEGTEPLKPSLERLGELLGVEVKTDPVQ